MGWLVALTLPLVKNKSCFPRKHGASTIAAPFSPNGRMSATRARRPADFDVKRTYADCVERDQQKAAGRTGDAAALVDAPCFGSPTVAAIWTVGPARRGASTPPTNLRLPWSPSRSLAGFCSEVIRGLRRRATRRRRFGRIAKGARRNAGLDSRHRRPETQSQYFAEGSVPVDGAEQPVLERVDGANEIGKYVRLVNQHRHATRRQTFPNAHRPWQANRDVVAPAITGKRDRLARRRRYRRDRR